MMGQSEDNISNGAKIIERVTKQTAELEKKAASQRKKLAKIYDDIYAIQQELNKVSVDYFEFPTRVKNALYDNDIKTVGDLLIEGKHGLSTLMGMGAKGVNIIEDALQRYGLDLPYMTEVVRDMDETDQHEFDLQAAMLRHKFSEE